MAVKVTVHSNLKRFFQVAGAALVFAAFLVGLRGLADLARPVKEETNSAEVYLQSKAVVGVGENLLSGRATVVDGDTIKISDDTIRLDGIDSFERQQRCGAVGADWPCGEVSATKLSEKLKDAEVECLRTGADRYGRTLARCFLGDTDLQLWLVVNGLALAYREYSDDYTRAEEVAQARRAGAWAHTFDAPWEWRRNQTRSSSRVVQ